MNSAKAYNLVSAKVSSMIRPPAQRQLHWYVVQTLTGKEALAAESLQANGFEILLPRVVRKVRHARQITTKLAPLFPGYFFVQIDIRHAPWRLVNASRGVLCLVGASNGRPTPMPTCAINAIMAQCENGIVREQGPGFAPGDRARIATGPLSERVGRISQLDSQGRVSLLMEILGRETLIKMDAVNLEAV